MKDNLSLLKIALANKRLSHLYLFSGPRGAGKMKLAYDFAALILNDYLEKDFFELLIENNVPNLVIIQSESQTIKKEQILDLQDEFSLTSLVAGPRIYIINEIEKLSNSAANSLLKFMEEPMSQNTIGILTTNNLAVVIPTIRSRAQILTVDKISDKILIDELSNAGIPLLNAIIYTQMTSDVKIMLTYPNDPNVEVLVSLFLEFVKEISNQDSLLLIKILDIAKPIFYNRELMLIFSELMVLFFLDCYHQGKGQNILFTPLLNEIKKTNKIIQEENISNNIEKVKGFINTQKSYINLELGLTNLMNQIEKSR